MKAPVSFIIPTRNEERNIREAIESVIDWAGEVFVLDSYSDDRTVEIATGMGVQVAQRRFDNFSAQKNWALDNLPLRNEWVFFLDADERVTRALRDELQNLLSGTEYDGFYVPRHNFFMGICLRHGGWLRARWVRCDESSRLFRHPYPERGAKPRSRAQVGYRLN